MGNNLECGRCKKTIHYTSEDIESVHDIPYVECESCYSIIGLNGECRNLDSTDITFSTKTPQKETPKDKLISADRVQSFLSAVLRDQENSHRNTELENTAYHQGFMDAIKTCQKDLVYRAGADY